MKTLPLFLFGTLTCLFLAPSVLAEDKKEPKYQGKTVREWVRLVQTTTDQYERYRAIKVLGKVGPEAKAVVPALIRILGDKRHGWATAYAAQDTLANIGPDAASGGPVLIKAQVRFCKLGDDEFFQKVLKKVGPGAVKHIITSLVQEEDDEYREVAVYNLGRFGTSAVTSAVSSMMDALKSKDHQVRSRAASTLGEIGPKAEKAIPALVQVAQDQSTNVRVHVLEALGTIGKADPGVVDALTRALEDKGTMVRVQATTALGQIAPNNNRITTALLKALDDKEIVVRVEAIRALGKISPANNTIATAILKALDDKETLVRETVVDVIGRSTNKTILSGLLKALKDRESEVRWSALRELGRLSPSQAQLIGTPQEMATILRDISKNDPDPDLREDAAEMLKSINK